MAPNSLVAYFYPAVLILRLRLAGFALIPHRQHELPICCYHARHPDCHGTAHIERKSCSLKYLPSKNDISLLGQITLFEQVTVLAFEHKLIALVVHSGFHHQHTRGSARDQLTNGQATV